MIVKRVTVQSALWWRDRRRERLPLHWSVRWVQVDPTDTIVPAAPLEWDGAADDMVRQMPRDGARPGWAAKD